MKKLQIKKWSEIGLWFEDQNVVDIGIWKVYNTLNKTAGR